VLDLLRRLYVARFAKSAGSEGYWRRRYEVGGDSGSGSYGRHAEFKAAVLNEFVLEQGVASVIEFGCGDGNQLTLARYPSYVGYDVSERAVELCRQRFADDATKSFSVLRDYAGDGADLALSLDVVYHLIEDDVFETHLRTLFGAAERFVIVFSSNAEPTGKTRTHVRHRRFTDWVDENANGWELRSEIEDPAHRRDESDSNASFFIFSQKDAAASSS